MAGDLFDKQDGGQGRPAGAAVAGGQRQAEPPLIGDGLELSPRDVLIYIPLSDGVKYQLYDMTRDPYCSHNVAQKNPKITTQLTKRLNDWMRQERGALRVGRYVLPGQ